MAQIDKPNLHFNTKLYTGNATNPTTISGIGFQPDWVWTKLRAGGTEAHRLCDAVRGATKDLFSNATDAEATNTIGLKSFNADGYVIGNSNGYNLNTGTFVSWNWKAGTTSGLTTNGTTTITPTSYSFNSTAGFSILKYTGNGAAGAYVAHGLGTTPATIIVKKTSGSAGWFVYHQKLQSTYNIYLNTSDAEFGGAYVYSPDATNFRLRDHNDVNQNNETYVAYCFAEKKGFSKFGSYTGNGNTDGAFVYTGFKPALIILKHSNSSGNNWRIIDNKRDPDNVTQKELYPSTNDSEGSADRMDLLSNGFKLRSSGSPVNDGAYIYMAWAENPIVGSNNIPTVAR